MGHSGDYIHSREAIALLDVKLQTLYAYVSRGLIRSVPVNDGSKERLYLRADIEKLRYRADARSGHGPAAAAALHYGPPVIASEITELTEAGPRYRGHLATDLAERATFEEVAILLWGDAFPAGERTPVRPAQLPRWIESLCREIHARYGESSLLHLFATYVFARGIEANLEHDTSALPMMYGLTGFFGYLSDAKTYRMPKPNESIARAVLHACGRPAGATAVRALNAALVVLADYELASATFVARVAASSGADINACLVAAIESSSGWVIEHRRVERLLDGVRSGTELQTRIERYRENGDVPPGFQASLRAAHDPRTDALLDFARRVRPQAELTALVTAFLSGAAGRFGLHGKAVLGLEVFARALDLPRGAVPGVFLLARVPGWVAHILEQYTSDSPLRPRAKFSPRTSPQTQVR